jgi:hypothetical protein
MMFYKVCCPTCNHANTIDIFRSKYTIRCPKCDSAISIDGNLAYWIELVIFTPIYFIVMALGEVVLDAFMVTNISHWYLYLIVILVGYIFHGFAFSKLASISVIEEEKST